MKNRYTLVLPALAAVFITTTGCFSKMTFGNSSRWLPPGFNPKTSILLVEKFALWPSYNKKMEEYMQKKYPYRYEFTSSDSISHHVGKYADTKLYKYALVWESHGKTTTSYQPRADYANGAGWATSKAVGFDCHFYNCNLGTNYPETRKSASIPTMVFKPVINTIVKKFPLKRKR